MVQVSNEGDTTAISPPQQKGTPMTFISVVILIAVILAIISGVQKRWAFTTIDWLWFAATVITAIATFTNWL